MEKDKMVELSPASVFQKVQAHQADNVTTCDVTIFASHTQFAIVQCFVKFQSEITGKEGLWQTGIS